MSNPEACPPDAPPAIPPVLASAPRSAAPAQIEPAVKRRTSPIFAIAGYLLFVFIGAAIVAPRFYASAQFLAQEVSPRFYWLASQPFHRYVNRCMILLAIIALPSFLRALGVRSIWEFALKPSARRCAESVQGFFWGFFALGIATALVVGFGIREFDFSHEPARWIRHLRNAALAAVVVSVLEELLFRGAIFGALRRTQRFWTAAILSAALYAILHFLERPQNPRFVEWSSGFDILAQMLQGMTHWDALVPGFFNLAIIGVLLARAFERTGSLYFSIGLHAGLVFWVKSFAFLTNRVSTVASPLWGTNKLVDGWVATGLLVLLFLLVELTLPPRKPVEE